MKRPFLICQPLFSLLRKTNTRQGIIISTGKPIRPPYYCRLLISQILVKAFGLCYHLNERFQCKIREVPLSYFSIMTFSSPPGRQDFLHEEKKVRANVRPAWGHAPPKAFGKKATFEKRFFFCISNKPSSLLGSKEALKLLADSSQFSRQCFRAELYINVSPPPCVQRTPYSQPIYSLQFHRTRP